MNNFILTWFINCVALLVVLHTVSGIKMASWQTTIVAALVIGLLNIFIRPILLLLTLPVNILTLGILTLFINGLIFYMASKFISGFQVMSFSNAFWGALVFSIITACLNMLMK